MKIVIALLSFAACASGDQPDWEDVTLRQIRCEVLIARLPTAKGVGLQKELRNPKTAQQGLDKLLGLIEKNQAELVDWPTITTLSGNRAVAENVREIRYPIEYAVPEVQLKTPTSPEAKTLPAPTAPPDAPPPTAAPQPPGKLLAPGAKIPTDEIASTTGGISSFETRNVGVTVEIEPTIAPDGRNIQANLRSQHVSLTGHRREVYEVNNQLATAYEVPIFETLGAQTNIELMSGQPCLFGFFNLTDPKNTVELFILTLTIEETKTRMPRASTFLVDPSDPASEKTPVPAPPASAKPGE